MVFLRVAGDARDNFGAETLEVAVEPVVANVVTPAVAHNLKASSSHCDRAGQFGSPSPAPLNRKKDYTNI